jgi:hypothetical protein
VGNLALLLLHKQGERSLRGRLGHRFGSHLNWFHVPLQLGLAGSQHLHELRCRVSDGWDAHTRNAQTKIERAFKLLQVGFHDFIMMLPWHASRSLNETHTLYYYQCVYRLPAVGHSTQDSVWVLVQRVVGWLWPGVSFVVRDRRRDSESKTLANGTLG